MYESKGTFGSKLSKVDLEVPQENDSSFQEVFSPQLNTNGIVSLVIAFFCVFTFGVDQGSFGGINSHVDFLTDICLGDNFGDEITCGLNVTACDQIRNGNYPNHEYDSICKGTVNGLQCCAQIRGENKKWNLGVITTFNIVLLAGGILAALTAGPFIANKFGRRQAIGVGSVGIIIGATLQSYLNFGNYGVLLLGRLILGFFAGIQLYTVPLYGAETASASMRGRILGLFQFFCVLASFIFAVLSYTLGDSVDWRFFQILPAIVSPVTLIGCFFMARSPRFVMKKHGYDEGLEALQNVRAENATDEANAMWAKIKEEEKMEQLSYFKAFSTPNISTRTWTALIMNIAQQASGVNVIISLFTSIIQQIGVDVDSDLAYLIFQAVFLVFVTIGVYALDTFGGRRIQYLIGTAFMTLGSLLLGIGASYEPVKGMLAFVGVLCFAAGFQMSQGILAWAYPAEIFTMRERMVIGNLAPVSQWIANIIMIFFAIYANSHLKFAGYLFSGLNFGALIWSWFYVEETKGKTVEEMPEVFRHTPRGHWPLRKLEKPIVQRNGS